MICCRVNFIILNYQGNDEDVDLVSEDEGYDTEDDDDIEMDQWNFGIPLCCGISSCD